MLNCAELREGLTETCSRQCQYALIALLSTPEGERLMQCRCGSGAGGISCHLEKERVEPCRAEVTWHTAPDTEVSCSAASWICAADPQCSQAMLYYQENCKAMFKGRKCGKKCKNSLDIMLRQEAAAKLATCFCEGTEDFDCAAVRLHTDVLCFGKKIVAEEVETNEVEVVPGSGAARPGGRALVALVSFLASCSVSHLGAAVHSFLRALHC
jgi:growth arrest-specific protein 1